MSHNKKFELKNTYSPFANLDALNNDSATTENNNNKVDNEKKKTIDNKIGFEPYFLSDLLEDKKKNRDINKIKKGILPLLTYNVENENFSIIEEKHRKTNYNDYIKIMINDISLTINNIFAKFPLEFKEDFIDMSNCSPQDINIQMKQKIINIYNDAVVFLRDFRNIMMHKRIKENTFNISNKFKNYEGDLFSFFKIYLKKELNSKPSVRKENYLKKVIEHDISYISNIPFIYGLMTLSLFSEKQYIKEVLDLLKVSRFIEDIVLNFSIRGGYKSYIPGFGLYNQDEDLYLKQLNYCEDINSQVINTGRRVTKTYKDFNIEKKTQTEQNKLFSKYTQMLRLYGYRNSFPKITFLEESIRNYKAKEIYDVESKKIEEQEKSLEKVNNFNAKRRLENDIRNRKNNRKTLEDISENIYNVFRNNDVFMLEALEYLNTSRYNQFLNGRTWSIVGNAVIWMDPDDKVIFDVRKKVPPSSNSINSLYKILFNHDTADKYSLNRHNLRALLTSILLEDKWVEVTKIREHASNTKKESSNNNTNNNYSLQRDIQRKIPTWNRHTQASFVIKIVRKSIFKDQKLHNRDSISFHERMKILLYKLDDSTENIYTSAIDLIKRYGVLESQIDDDTKKILRIDNLKDMAMYASNFVHLLQKEKKKSNDNKYTFKTWSKYAFLPCNTKNKEIYSILKWDTIKANYLNKGEVVDVYQILYNYHKKKNMQFPPIIALYEDYISKNKLNKKEEKEVRNILAEELILSILSTQNIDYIFGLDTKKNSCLYLDKVSSSSDNTILDFDLVWKLKYPIRINIKEYVKKDVKSALSWIFDDARIISEGSLQNTEENLNKKIETIINSYKFIRNDKILSRRAPKVGDIIIDYNNLDALAIKHIVKTLRWLQKEFLFYICNIESDLIYHLIQKLTTHEFEELCKDKKSNEYKGYIDFSVAVHNYDRLVNKVDKRIIVARNMFCHGRVLDSDDTNFEYKDIVPIVADFYYKIFKKHYYDVDKKNNNFKKK